MGLKVCLAIAKSTKTCKEKQESCISLDIQQYN